ncbi:MAG: hypothetical protein K0U64_03155, partial [Actinomycetia bacterium]|nr:hypothetical protein [Actinomycetes bacterium]
MARTRLAPNDITKRPVLQSFDAYEDAQKLVDRLSDARFPVENVAIVGVDLRMVEAVLGRMSWARAALGGLATFAWLGAFIGLFVSFFGGQEASAVEYVLLGLLYGSGFGIVFGLASFAIQGRRHEFVSQQQIIAARYDVLCDSDFMAQARKALGIAAVWPPPLDPAVPAASETEGTSSSPEPNEPRG